MLVVFQDLFLILWERISWIRNVLWVRDMTVHLSWADVVLESNRNSSGCASRCICALLRLLSQFGSGRRYKEYIWFLLSHGNPLCFLSQSITHAIFLWKQSELQSDKPQRQLQRLSDTHWSCKYLAVDAVCSTFESVLATLEEIANGEDISRATEATCIWTQVQTFKVLVSLITFWRILSSTKSLSEHLQSRQMDLAKVADLVIATISSLKEFRSDSQWNHFYKYVPRCC